MNRVRKIGQWLWFNKERMVLVIMVGVLCYQVWEVVSPPEGPEVPNYSPPTGGNVQTPIPPPPPAGLGVPPATAELERRNMFTWFPPQEAGGEEEQEIELNIRLVGIRPNPVGDGCIAEIRTGRTNYVEEGDTFEQFQVISIDCEEEIVVVFAEALGREISLGPPS